MRNRSSYEKLSEKKTEPTKGKLGGVNTKRMFDNVLRKYEKEMSQSLIIPTCQIPVAEEVKDKPAVQNKYGKKAMKRRIIRRHK